MSISNFNEIYKLECDVCGKNAREDFYDFYSAVRYKIDNGWISRKINGQWMDICPDCKQSYIK